MPRQENFTSARTAHSDWDGVPQAMLTGFLDGIMGGSERFANGLTNGWYGKIIDGNMNNAYTNRQNRLQTRANNASVGIQNSLTNHFLDIDAELMNYYLFKK